MNDDEQFIPAVSGMFQPYNSHMTVVENKDHNRIEVHIRGEILSPEHYNDSFITLYAVAETYDQCLVYINTPGGCASTLTEFLAVLDKFKTVVTVGSGIVASAGFTIWCRGDIRVVQKYTSMMAHRESYGSHAKTAQMLEQAKHIDDVYGLMMRDICGDILTPEELKKAEFTEVNFTADEMIRRKKAISWNQFIECEFACYYPNRAYVKIRENEYQLFDDNSIIISHDLEKGEITVAGLYDVIYNVPSYPTKTIQL